MAKRGSRPTIKDVARHAGVSIATVSAVINNAGWVPDATRARVQESVDQLGYRPNRLARGLKTRQSDTVGVIVSDVTNPFFTDIVRSLGHVLREHDRNLVLCDSEHRFDLGEKNFRMLLEKQVDALVLIGDSVKQDVLGRYIARGGDVPIVAIERDYDVPGVSKLLVDSEKGGFQATLHLLEEGFSRIGMISGPLTGPGSTSYGCKLRLKGYKKALGSANLPFREEFVSEGNFQIGGGREAMRRLLALSERPDAVFASNDLMAVGAMQVARDFGLDIPGDMAIVGYDDIPIAAHVYPSLTTMAMPRGELGGVAADLLIHKIRDPRTEPVRRLFAARLVVRGSSAGVSAVAVASAPETDQASRGSSLTKQR
jgi:LacI family transcriptional regulator